MLSKKVWGKIKKKLVELPAERRAKELEVLKIQTVDKDVLKEIKDLLGKAKLELQSKQWHDWGGEISISSRIQTFEDDEPQGPAKGLEEVVADVPEPVPQEKEPEINYASTEGYASGEGYMSKGYENPADTLAKQAAEARGVKTAEDVRQSFGDVSPSDYTKRMTKR